MLTIALERDVTTHHSQYKMNIFVVNLILFLLTAIKCQQEKYFSSLVQLEKLAVIESEFITKLAAIVDEVSDEDYVRK